MPVPRGRPISHHVFVFSRPPATSDPPGRPLYGRSKTHGPGRGGRGGLQTTRHALGVQRRRALAAMRLGPWNSLTGSYSTRQRRSSSRGCLGAFATRDAIQVTGASRACGSGGWTRFKTYGYARTECSTWVGCITLGAHFDMTLLIWLPLARRQRMLGMQWLRDAGGSSRFVRASARQKRRRREGSWIRSPEQSRSRIPRRG